MSRVPLSGRHILLISRHAAANAVRSGTGLVRIIERERLRKVRVRRGNRAQG